MDRFGEKLRALRLSKGLTLQELAKRLGYTSHSHFSELESGKKGPSVDFVLKVAGLFDVSTDVLLRDDVDLEVEGGADVG